MTITNLPVTDFRTHPEHEESLGQTGSEDADLFDAVLGVWRSLAAGAAAPEAEKFRPELLGKWLKKVVWTKVVDGGAEFEIEVVGEHIDNRLARQKAKTSLVALHAGDSDSKILRAYRSIVKRAAPEIFLFDYDGPIEAITGTRELYLPLLNDDGAVGRILVAIQFLNDVNVPHNETRWHRPE